MTSKATTYQILVRGHLDERWQLVLDGATIHKGFDTDGRPITRLDTCIVDQSALYGTLNRLRDLGAALISVQEINQDLEETL